MFRLFFGGHISVSVSVSLMWIIIDSIAKAVWNFLFFAVAAASLSKNSLVATIFITVSCSLSLISSRAAAETYLSARSYSERKKLTDQILNAFGLGQISMQLVIVVVGWVTLSASFSVDDIRQSVFDYWFILLCLPFSFIGRYSVLEYFYHGTFIFKLLLVVKHSVYFFCLLLKVVIVSLGELSFLPLVVFLESLWILAIYQVWIKWIRKHKVDTQVTRWVPILICVVQGFLARIDLILFSKIHGSVLAGGYAIWVKPIEAWVLLVTAFGQLLLSRLGRSFSFTALTEYWPGAFSLFVAFVVCSSLYYSIFNLEFTLYHLLLYCIILIFTLYIGIQSRIFMFLRFERWLLVKVFLIPVIFSAAVWLLRLEEPLVFYFVLVTCNFIFFAGVSLSKGITRTDRGWRK